MTQKTNKDSPLLIFWFCLAFILRFSYLLFQKNHYLFFNYPAGDVSYYLDWSIDIASGNWAGSDVFWGMPLYAYILAVFQNLSLGHSFVIHIFQILLASLQPVFVFLIAQRIFNRRIAFVSAALVTTNFVLMDFDCLLMPTSLMTLLGLIIVWYLLKLREDETGREWLGLGILIGLTALGDGKILIFLVMLVFLLKREGGRNEIFFKRCVCLILGTLVVVSAVAVRNRIAGGSWVPITAQTGLSFYVGNHRGADGIFNNEQSIRPTHQGQDIDQRIIAENAEKRPLSAAEVSGYWMKEGLQFIRSYPGEYIALLGRKMINFWIEHEGANDADLIFKREWQEKLDLNPFSLIVALALIGFLYSLKNKTGSVYLSAMILSQLLFTLIFFLTTKHRATILPFLIIYEGAGIIWLVDQIIQKKLKIFAGGLAVVIFMIMAFAPVRLPDQTVALLSHSRRGFIFEKQELFDKAVYEYRQALEIDPQDANLYYNLGNIYFRMQKMDEAQTQYTQCLEINPLHNDCIFNLGAAFQSLGQNEKAEALFEKALTMTPNSADAHFRLLQIAIQSHNCPQARQHAQEIYKILKSTPTEVSQMVANCHQ